MYPPPSKPSVPGSLSAPEGLDLDCLDALLRMMGPQAPELLSHAISDLGAVRSGLDGAGPDDWQRLRQHSHVLVALAGTLGERRLQALAEMLNRNVHAGHITDLTEIHARLGALTDYLAARRDG